MSPREARRSLVRPAVVIRRNRALEALAKRVEIQSREYNRIAQRLEADRAHPPPAPV